MSYYNEETGKVNPVIPELLDVVNYYHLGLKDGDVLPVGYEYIGRKNGNPVLKELPESIFHNPFPVSKTNDKKERIKLRIEAVLKFKKYLWQKLLSDQIKKEDILKLKDKKLVCFCGDNLCHGHVIKMFINYILNNELEFDKKKEQYLLNLKNKPKTTKFKM